KSPSPRTRYSRHCSSRTSGSGPRASPRCLIPSPTSSCRPGKKATARKPGAMLRLPWFEHRAPRSVAEAAKILAGEGSRAMLIAGGTDLLPNMKRRHQAPQVLVSLAQVDELRKVNGSFGSAVTLSELAGNARTPTAL